MQRRMMPTPHICALLVVALLLGALGGAKASASPAAVESQPPDAAAQAQSSHAVDAIAFMVITMVIGVFTLHMLTPVTHVPYTALLLVRPHPSGQRMHCYVGASNPSGQRMQCLWGHLTPQASACHALWGHLTPQASACSALWRHLSPQASACSARGGHPTNAFAWRASIQVWGVILGIGNQSFSEGWNLIGNGTRQWEVRHHPFLDKERHEGPALPQHCTCLPPESMGMTSWVPAQSINPTLLLTAFLPVLLFGAASVLEYHTARRLMWSSLLLAGARRWPLP